MGRGGYHGGSSIVGFGGGGWGGTGSPTMQKASKGRRISTAKKRKRKKPADKAEITVPKDLSTHPDVKKAKRRFDAVKSDLHATRARLELLERHLAHAATGLRIAVFDARKDQGDRKAERTK